MSVGGAHGGVGSGGGHMGGSFHGAMPAQGFHGVPQGFHGSVPHGVPAPSAFHVVPGRPGNDLARFNGHDFAHLTPADHVAWSHGGWRHAWHHGHYGWWWVANGGWFFYPEPIYPYPEYIGSEYYYDYDEMYGTPDYYWYYCEDPPGYYPYVKYCNTGWQAVPPAP